MTVKSKLILSGVFITACLALSLFIILFFRLNAFLKESTINNV